MLPRRYKELGFPEKAAEVPALLEKYAGRERLLMQKLHHKYGVNPVREGLVHKVVARA